MQLQLNKQSKTVKQEKFCLWLDTFDKYIALSNLNTSTGKGIKLISNSIKIQGIKVISTNS